MRYGRYTRYGGQVVLLLPADEEVGDVGTAAEFLFSGILLEIVGDGDVQVRTFPGLFAPLVVGVHVGEGYDLAAVEDLNAVVEAGLSAGGEPNEVGHHSGADDGGLFSLNEAYDFLRIRGEEVLAKEALGHGPAFGDESLAEHRDVYPVDGILCRGVFDAVACLTVVLHDFASTDAAFDVYLVEDDIAGLGDTDEVLADEPEDGLVVKERGEEVQKVGERVGADGLEDYVLREGAVAFVRFLNWFRALETEGGLPGIPGAVPVWCAAPALVFVGRVLDVAAGGLMVASAVFFAGGVVVFVHVGGEAVFAAALGAGPTGGGACVLEEVVTVVHTMPPPLCTADAAGRLYRLVSVVLHPMRAIRPIRRQILRLPQEHT